MKAIILKGKNKGKVVKISQWCNDWFTVDTGTMMDVKPFSPASLAFTVDGMSEILSHGNNGMMLTWFETTPSPAWTGKYIFTFKKRKPKFKL